MPKKYEFFFTFSTQSFNHSGISSEFFTLGHKELTAQDLFDVSCKFREEHGCSANVISFVLNKVTGDFTYLVHYKTEQVGCEPEQSSIMVTLDHKITTKSFNKDVTAIAKMIFDIDEDDIETEIPATEILSFQEIPEE